MCFIEWLQKAYMFLLKTVLKQNEMQPDNSVARLRVAVFLQSLLILSKEAVKFCRFAEFALRKGHGELSNFPSGNGYVALHIFQQNYWFAASLPIHGTGKSDITIVSFQIKIFSVLKKEKTFHVESWF